VIEATRILDGTQVQLKKLSISPNTESEIEIGQFFSSDPQKSDLSNHCVPFYDTINVPDEETRLIVMPLLTHWEEPAFETVGEVLEFFRQIFEVGDVHHSCLTSVSYI
jgi:hypothetical protein